MKKITKLRKPINKILTASQSELNAMIENLPMAIFLVDKERRVRRANVTATKFIGTKNKNIAGLSAGEALRCLNSFYSPRGCGFSPACKNCIIRSTVNKTFKERKSFEKVETAITIKNKKEKKELDLLVSTSLVDVSNEQLSLVCIEDITELKKREMNIIKLNRIFKAKGDINKAIIFSKDETEYLKEICRIIIEDCGYTMVWIGLAEKDQEKTVRPVASAGFEEGYVEKLKITWSPDSPRGKGPTGTAIRTGKIIPCRNMLKDPLFKPWRKEAIKRGYASSIAFPLKMNSETLGAITIYSKETNPFSDSEIKILKELAEDATYGVTFFRLKAASKKAEEKIQHLASFPRLNPNPIVEINSLGHLTFANEAAKSILKKIGANHKITEFLPKDIKSILAELNKDNVRHFYKEVQIGKEFFGETIHLAPQYNVVRIYAINITERKTAEELIEYSSTHDILTGVYNRYFFEKQLQKFRKMRKFNGGVFMIDVNGLKKINDEFGHLAGDNIIQKAANFLVSKLRKKDLVARFGGDEFCVLLPNTNPDEIKVLASRLKIKSFGAKGDNKLSISIGSAYAQKGSDIDNAIEMADEEMYKNKFSGKISQPEK
jgi:diguanylate cyclase (GGDEF)-like protein